MGSEAISIMCSRQSFAGAVARESALWRLVQVLERPDPTESSSEFSHNVSGSQEAPKRKILSWSVLEALSSSPVIALQIISSGIWLELLGVLVGYSGFSKSWATRSGAAKTLSRLLWDPATGPKIGK
jgi:hypothetical protein